MSHDPPNKSRHLEAFKENFNLVGLASAAALSAATLTPIPLLVGLVAEAAYLIFVPDSKWFEARQSQRFEAEIARRREAMEADVLPQLRPATVERYRRLEAGRRQLAAQPMEGKWWLEVLRKLDYLLETFLRFASKEVQFRSYLTTVLEQERGAPLKQHDPDVDRPRDNREPERVQVRYYPTRRPNSPPPPPPGPKRPPSQTDEQWIQNTVTEVQACYDREMEGIRALLAAETDLNTQAVLNKRVEVLQRRHEHVGKIGRILINLNHQLLLLDDTFGLINDEIRARPPDQLLGEIEDVVSQTRSMTQLLEEMAPYEQMLQRLNTPS